MNIDPQGILSVLDRCCDADINIPEQKVIEARSHISQSERGYQ
jgi:hypothetical protein